MKKMHTIKCEYCGNWFSSIYPYEICDKCLESLRRLGGITNE